MKLKNLIFLLLINSSAIFAQEIDILSKYNGDFEQGAAFWRFFEVPASMGSSWEITDDVINGNQAMKLLWKASDGTVVDRGFDNWSAGVPVIAGEDYTLKAFMKKDPAYSNLLITCTVGFFSFEGQVISQKNEVYELTDTYTEQGFVVTAPSNAALSWIAFRMFDTSSDRVEGTIFLDNIRLLGDASASTDLTPRLMPTSLTTEDVPIASINVMEEPYNAKNDGSVDATSAFQDAINRAVIAGGAVVYIPAGNYRLDGNIVIPERVILRGEWSSPENGNGVSGTVLMPYGEKGNEDGRPFIKIKTGSGIKNLSIWYPEQNASSVSAYPWTINLTGFSTSVINVNLVNSYNGIKVLPDPNALHYIRNVYGTPLNEGIWLSQTTDIGRIMNVRFEPKYWSESGLSDSPSEELILNWLQNNETTGLAMGRSDWEYLYDLSFVGYQTGIKIFKYTDFGPNGVMYGINIAKSKIGIDLASTNPIGWAVTNSSISVEGENSACVWAGGEFTSIVQFNTCTFNSDGGTAVKFSPTATGRLSFQNCNFDDWGITDESPAIDCERGSISVMGSSFALNKRHFRIGSGVRNSQILDNNFPEELKIENKSQGEILISQEPLNFTKQNIPPHPYATVPRPVNDGLFNIIDYGAVADGTTDNTLAIQDALDAAELNNGGTVYIPSGMFRISSHIIVPTGVELRGIWDVPHHSMSKGSILLAFEGKNNAEGTPFISLETGSGVRGFTVWYPEQSSESFFPYPWTIQTLGEDCWVKDVSLGNPYQALDMGSYPSAGHRVSYLGAAPLKTGISVDKCTGEGWIENVQLNPHYWGHTSGYPQVSAPVMTSIISLQQSQLDAFKIASASNEHVLGNFVFAAKRGLYLAPDNGNSNINVFLHGTDAGSNAVFLESKAGSKINLVNTQLVLLGTEQNGIITSVPGFGADVSFFNTISWGGPGPTTNISGEGNILIQQLHTLNGGLSFSNGTTRLENIKIRPNLNPQYIIGSDTKDLKIYGSTAPNGLIMYNYAIDKSIVELDYYYNLNKKENTLITGWENDEIENTWENTFYGHKDFVIDDILAFQCESVDTEVAHSGTYTLKVIGTKIEDSSPYYKIFDSNTSIFYNSTITYWIKPQDESGRGGFIDLLFTDGTRLSELSPVASDGLALNAPRGTIGEWIEVNCAIGDYAHGKVIQTVLVGADLDTDDIYSFLVDDLSIDGVVSVEPSFTEKYGTYISQNYPNPFSNTTNIDISLNKAGFVSFIVFDMLGNKIAIIVDELHYMAGSYQLNWTPNNLESGVYFGKMEFVTDSGNKMIVNRKMILEK